MKKKLFSGIFVIFFVALLNISSLLLGKKVTRMEITPNGKLIFVKIEPGQRLVTAKEITYVIAVFLISLFLSLLLSHLIWKSIF